jgi:hypothetical protein
MPPKKENKLPWYGYAEFCIVPAIVVAWLLVFFGTGVMSQAANGPSLDYLEKNINKVDYGDVVMEVGPPNKKEVLPDGSIIAMWSYDITQIDAPPGLIGGYLVRGEQYKMLRFDSNGILRSYKWKAGIIGGDSKEDDGDEKSKGSSTNKKKKSQPGWASDPR